MKLTQGDIYLLAELYDQGTGEQAKFGEHIITSNDDGLIFLILNFTKTIEFMAFFTNLQHSMSEELSGLCTKKTEAISHSGFIPIYFKQLKQSGFL